MVGDGGRENGDELSGGGLEQRREEVELGLEFGDSEVGGVNSNFGDGGWKV